MTCSREHPGAVKQGCVRDDERFGSGAAGAGGRTRRVGWVPSLILVHPDRDPPATWSTISYHIDFASLVLIGTLPAGSTVQ